MKSNKTPPGRGTTAELTPAVLNNILQHCQNLSRSRPRQTETILKLARAQVAINKALEPCEQSRKDLLATLPAEPTTDTGDKLKEAYQKAKNEVDEKYRDIYLKQLFTVKFPTKITKTELQQFQDPPNPIDLVGVHPYLVEIEEEEA